MSKLRQSPSADTLNSSSSSQFLFNHDSPVYPRRMSMPGSDHSPSNSLPLSLTSLDHSPGSPAQTTQERERPFKSKSKHNLAAFGAKLTSTAASVGVHASKYKQRDSRDQLQKDNGRDSVFVDVSEPRALEAANTSSPSNNSGNALLKSMMFRQSKTDIKSLKLKTDLGISRTSTDRSPMVRGGTTKELDRIAAIGQPNSPVQGPEFSFGHHNHHHLHHPHLSFRKRDSPAAVLSSSASNSTLASEGTVYSFNPSNTGTTLSRASTNPFKNIEEARGFLDSTWNLLRSRIQPVFNKEEEPLRVPVEDFNILIVMHFTTHHLLGCTGLEMLTRVDELFVSGFKSSHLMPQPVSLKGFTESWQLFYSYTLTALEATFLPLQLEFDGVGQVFTSKKAAQEYWFPVAGTRPTALGIASSRKAQKLTVRRKILMAYRDAVVLPALPHVGSVIDTQGSHLASGTHSHENLSLLLQCLSMLTLLRTNDASQKKIEEALAITRQSWISRSRTVKEHRTSVGKSTA